jgi:hypothetical protein
MGMAAAQATAASRTTRLIIFWNERKKSWDHPKPVEGGVSG